MTQPISLSKLLAACSVVLLGSLLTTNAMAASALAITNSASPVTQQMNAAVLNQLPFSNKTDFADAKRGFIATIPDATIKKDNGQIVWSLKQYAFLSTANAPATVNPSLWRQAQLNMNNGLFKVADRIYQVRGFDISNMDIIEGDTGIIIIDPLISAETAKAALDLYYQHRPKKPVVAVIYTHSHVDHYGGVKGVVSEADVQSGKVKIIAPEGFLQSAISENVYAGNAMSRRSIYMYGALLPKGETGQVDGGLGKNVSLGTITLIPPTDTITTTGETQTIDGVQIVFLMAPNTEAPAEMLMYFPQFHALCVAEDATHNLHNLYTLRGAQIRDAMAWWKTLNEAITLFGDKTDVVFAQHQWPTWGQTNVINFLSKQRDMYKYILDQTLRLMNEGYTMSAVGYMVKLPPSLANEWYNRGYYGTVSQDARAVYNKYLGYYDSNPVNLNPLPPVETSKKYVELMGGPQVMLTKAKTYYNNGDYQLVAQLMNYIVFADPTNQTAKNLEADALEQLGYQQENATWRNEYLMGAYELRNGVPAQTETETASPDTIKAMPLDMFFDYLGIRLNGPKAEGKTITFNWNFTDTKQHYAVALENSVLSYTPNAQFPHADTTLSLTRATLDAINLRQITIAKAIANGDIKVSGDSKKLDELFALFDNFPPMFNIMTPNAETP